MSVPDNSKLSRQIPPPAASVKTLARRKRCRAHITKFLNKHNRVQRLYDENRLEDVVDRAMEIDAKLKDSGCTPEFSQPLTLLALYDIVVLIDDSSSVNFEQNGERKKALERILHEITKVYDLANSNGLKSVQFLNAGKAGYDVKNSDVPGIFKYRVYNGPTRIGTELKRKVLDRFVFPIVKPIVKPIVESIGKPIVESIVNPLMVITITDGEIEGEKKGHLEKVITACVAKYPVVFQFSQVGNHMGAEKMLNHLDNHDKVGKSVDWLKVDSLLDNLADPDLKWHSLTKILIGAIDEFWDEQSADPESQIKCDDSD